MDNNLVLSDKDKQEFEQLAITAGQVFNPTTPVSEKDLFSGRTEQIRSVVDIIFQKGQHAIIFGERGVGKTSLANVISSFVSTPNVLLVTRVNGDKGDTFDSVWRKLFDEMQLTKGKYLPGFNERIETNSIPSNNFFGLEKVSPNDIKKALLELGQSFLPVIIIDEFDRLEENVRKLFADLIKGLSDYSLNATIVLIGVGDSVEQLIHEHQSVTRALIQVQMPRMKNEEIRLIIINAITRLGMTIQDDVLSQITLLSKGLPHYTHLIGLHATRNTLDNYSLELKQENFDVAIEKAIKGSQHSIKTDYHKAIKSAYKNNLFAQVLLACSLCKVNELGEFAAQDLREPMCIVTGKNYKIPHYAQHLNEFTSDKRGNILIKTGERRFYRYKFTDPLMQPFVIMQGIIDKRITKQSLD